MCPCLCLLCVLSTPAWIPQHCFDVIAETQGTHAGAFVPRSGFTAPWTTAGAWASQAVLRTTLRRPFCPPRGIGPGPAGKGEGEQQIFLLQARSESSSSFKFWSTSRGRSRTSVAREQSIRHDFESSFSRSSESDERGALSPPWSARPPLPFALQFSDVIAHGRCVFNRSARSPRGHRVDTACFPTILCI